MLNRHHALDSGHDKTTSLSHQEIAEDTETSSGRKTKGMNCKLMLRGSI